MELIPINHPPTLPYKGLTIILDQPSRFDTKHLISGNAGSYFDSLLLPITRFNCDIILANDSRELLPNTKVILLLGQAALEKFAPGIDRSLNTYRGSPYIIYNKDQKIICIPTFTPQDSFDRKNYEHPENEDEQGDDETDEGGEKDNQKTRRKNFKFWFHNDVRKAIRLLQHGIKNYPTVSKIIATSADSILEYLKKCKDGYLTIDIETNPLWQQSLTCIGILWSPTNKLNEIKDEQLEVIVIPFMRYNKELFYTPENYCRIFVALTVAMRSNLVIGHNLSFDLFILLYKYHLHPPINIADTMVRHHRLHPEVEKSLGHCITYYTDEQYHKDESGGFNPVSFEAENKLWMYNAKDVITTFFIYCEQEISLAKAGATVSAEQACKCIRSILAMQFEGLLCDTDKLCKMLDETDKRLDQFARILTILTKRTFNPRSSQQVCKYLYDELKLPRPLYKPTDKESLFKLYAKYRIPSLRVILAYRVEGKQASMFRKIKFWKGNRFTCAYSVCGTDTYRLNSRALLGFKG